MNERWTGCDLSRTAAAIERRDRLVPLVWAAIDRMLDRDCEPVECNARTTRLIKLANRIERTVGVAFGLDTNRLHGGPNDPQVCADLVRAGEPTPALGDRDVSPVRRWVRRWQASRDDGGR